MSDSIDPDEMAHNEPSHLDLCCLQRPIIIACGSERVNINLNNHNSVGKGIQIIFYLISP